MTIIRCIDCEFDNTRMTGAGFEIIGIEDYRWADGHLETEILWGRDEPPISAQVCRSDRPEWQGRAQISQATAHDLLAGRRSGR
jgi:hypothetical protein